LFVNAIRQLDDATSAFVYGSNAGHEGADASGNITYWDMQEQIHKDAHAHGIDVHAGPAFVPWHRVIVNRLEQSLRLVDPRLSLHYWDWTTDPRVATADWVAILTGSAPGSPQGFMGKSFGNVAPPPATPPNAGVPFADFESTEITGDPVLGLPGDGYHDHVWRNVQSGAPGLDSDHTILGNLDFTSFNAALQNAHNTAHGYINGTLADAHYSFHDPMVFLLHSNMDRLWATWQRDPAHKDRLDPAKAYGTILTDEGITDATYFDAWVQPWAGVFGGDPTDPQNGNVSTDLNPWKSDVSQQAHVPYNDPSVIIPASYDTAVHVSYIIVNRDTFSSSEVNAKGAFPVTFANAFSVVYDGFDPRELGVTAGPLPSVPPNLPTFSFTGASNVQAVNPIAIYEDPSGAVDMPQRIMISYDLQFANASDFPITAGGEAPVGMQASLTYTVDTGTGGTVVSQTATASTELVLVNQPNPYMIDTQPGDPSPYWLSVDTRVFQVKGPGGGNPAGQIAGVTQGDMDADHNAPFTFIQNVVSQFNSFNPANPADPSHPFLTQLSEDESASQLELSQKVGGQRVYNYAVAKVRYLAPAGVPATSVGVFFRVFSTAVSALDYDGTGAAGIGNYRRTGNINASSVPLLGIENDFQGNPETACVPFFASGRVRTNSGDEGATAVASMTTQPPDATNVQTINSCAGGGGTAPCPVNTENVSYFGVWLDINLAPGDPNFRQFPLSSVGVSGWPDGPYSGTLQSLQQLMLGTHHCMVAEIFFWPPGTTGDPIPFRAGPASSGRLAQRNLALVKSGNPGYPDTHSVQHTFVIKPPVTPVDPRATQSATAARGAIGPDELIVRWNNVPRNSEATFYLPEVDADEILRLSAPRQHPTVLEKMDAHTLRCRLSDMTFIPLPSRRGTIAGLVTLVLPQGIRVGEVYKFTVEQYSASTLRTLGAFQMTIPVRPDFELLPEELTKLSVMRYIQRGVPATSRWNNVFTRYVDQIATRVRGFGGDPGAVQPSPSGDWYCPADGLGGLMLTFTDKTGNQVDDVADIFLKHTVLSDRREIRCWPTTTPLLVLDLIATNSGIYEIQALLPHHKAAGRFVTIQEGQITQAQLALSPEH
jgi:hypothetical protein